MKNMCACGEGQDTWMGWTSMNAFSTRVDYYIFFSCAITPWIIFLDVFFFFFFIRFVYFFQ